MISLSSVLSLTPWGLRSSKSLQTVIASSGPSLLLIVSSIIFEDEFIKLLDWIRLRRSLADQLEGNEDEHSKYRSMVVQYIVVSVPPLDS